MKESTFQALHEATLLVANEIDLDKVLAQIVEAARSLVGSRYAALGVSNKDGYLETFVHSGMSADLVRQVGTLPSGRGLLGAIIAEQRTIRIPKISDDPRAYGLPENHPPMESFLGVPIIAGGEVLGNLYLTEKLEEDQFSIEDARLIEMLAANAAAAIQNARLFQQVEQLAVLEERTRIGMDLHDGVIQAVYGVGLTVETAKLVLPDHASESSQLIDLALRQLDDAIHDIRNYIMDLRPRRFGGNLQQGIEQLVREFEANMLVPIELHYDVYSVLTTPFGRTIFLTAQEALANVARHAKATRVWVSLREENQTLMLIIRDNGSGFDPATRHNRIGHGLVNMQQRARELDGKFELDSIVGVGTTLVVTLPLAQLGVETVDI
jgi:signal transduction histidine kinase